MSAFSHLLRIRYALPRQWHVSRAMQVARLVLEQSRIAIHAGKLRITSIIMDVSLVNLLQRLVTQIEIALIQIVLLVVRHARGLRAPLAMQACICITGVVRLRSQQARFAGRI